MPRMVFCKSLAIVSILITASADISYADTSMTQHGKLGGPSSGEWTRTLRIKGLKMRIDTIRDGEDFITIYDLNSGKGYQLYPKRKEAIVVDLKSASGPPPGKLRNAVKEAGKKREIAGMSCDEYSFELQSPATSPGYGVTYTENVSGTFCVSRTIPEGTEVTNFVQEALRRGYRVATSALSPTQSSSGSYFLPQEPNVLVIAAFIETKIKGAGSSSGTLAGITNTFTINDIKSDSIPDEDFQVPADWKQKKESNFR